MKLLKERCLESLILCNVLQLVIDCLNQGSFSGQNLVSTTHQRVLRIVFSFSDKLYTVKEKVLKQGLTDISLVCTWFPLNALQELALLQWLPVIHVPGSEHEIEHLTLVIDCQVQLESKEPSKNKAIEQLKAGKPLLGKDEAFAPLLESILSATLEGEMDAHLSEISSNRKV